MEDAFKAGFIIAAVIAVIVGLLIWVLRFGYRLLSNNFPSITTFVTGIRHELSR